MILITVNWIDDVARSSPDERYEKCMEELSVPYDEYEIDRRGLEKE